MYKHSRGRCGMTIKVIDRQLLHHEVRDISPLVLLPHKVETEVPLFWGEAKLQGFDILDGHVCQGTTLLHDILQRQHTRNCANILYY